ncbi:MAG TPA: hypothetical protein PKI00_02460 [Candidatus Pacearchaeota archaeon]|nr:hypothetical protein [Candidatus Pacearchaeota archaeon]HOC53728.1 hypothetical protein [Candidatus Pacearchaeota archaeon]HQM24732.1 hypothetical protein [Candidatus Pacearchaeota archaeon]
MAKQVIIALLMVTLIAAAMLSSGCLGFFSGYGKKAQEYTSADYSISQYKFFIDKYNAVRQMGSQILNADREISNFEKMYPNPSTWDWKTKEMYEDHLFVRNGYIQQYNKFVSDYNSRMRDLTTNQMWMKPQNFPSELQYYTPDSVITLQNSEELIIPNL